jgi:hypothetical protein
MHANFYTCLLRIPEFFLDYKNKHNFIYTIEHNDELKSDVYDTDKHQYDTEQTDYMTFIKKRWRNIKETRKETSLEELLDYKE